MSSIVLSPAANFNGDHKYAYDLNALAHNAKLCSSVAQEHGFSMRVVLKGGYLHANIIGELAQFTDLHFALGNYDKGALELLGGRDVATLYSSQLPRRAANSSFSRILATNVCNLSLLCGSVAPDVIIPVLTSENREGLDCSEIVEFLDHFAECCNGHFKVGGFQMNFGCVVEEPPQASEIQHLLDSLKDQVIMSRMVSNPVMSIGGSAVLPILPQLDVPKEYHCELRVGEAILVGSVPGGRNTFGLKSTSFASATILQELHSKHEGSRRLLLDIGHTVLDDLATDRDYDGLVLESLSSDVAVAMVSVSRSMVGDAEIILPLNYRETERALARHPDSISFLVGE